MSNNKILVLGSNGMLGKMISLHLNSLKNFDITVSSRFLNKFINDNFDGKYLNLDAICENINSIFNKKNEL